MVVSPFHLHLLPSFAPPPPQYLLEMKSLILEKCKMGLEEDPELLVKGEPMPVSLSLLDQ